MYDSENDLNGIYGGMNSMSGAGFGTTPAGTSVQETATEQTSETYRTEQSAETSETYRTEQSAETAQTYRTEQTAEAAQTYQTEQTQAAETMHRQTGYTDFSQVESGAPYRTYTSQTSTQTQNTDQAQNAAQARTAAYSNQGRAYAPQPERYVRAESRAPQKKKGNGFQKVMVSLSLGLLFGIFAGVGFVGVTQAYNAIQKSTPAAAVETNVIPGKAESESDTVYVPASEQEAKVIYTSAQTNVTGIVKEVMPAMVSITNNYTEVTTFWGQTYREDLSSSGSGIIVSRTDDELLIVTNQHVVADADELLVTLDDGTEVAARIKGTDKSMDLAVIAISTSDLSADTLNAISVASLGDSDELELGEQVIAIGNALGYGQSVTVGYISALDREIEMDDGSLRSFIQTDAAINPGNSGGALLNAAGEVIGINSNKIGGSSIEGMGYAIPITAASPIIGDLMERQTRNKVKDSDVGYMGISYQEVTDEISRMYGMPQGVYVVNVQEGSSAENAGIMKGDVITKFDGEGISSFEDLQDVLQYFAAGDTAMVTVMRPTNGEYVEYQLEITLGARPNRNR